MARARGGTPRTFLASLGDKVSRRNLLRVLAPPALVPLLSCPAWADRWDVVPTLSFGETYTDNVSLVQDASKQGDWVTQIIPGISITATGARSRFNVAYTPEFGYYAHGQRENQVLQRGNAAANAELAKQLLFIEAGARVDQYDISLQGPLTTSNINTTGNRATVTTFFASPYLLRDFGSAVRGEARFTYSAWNSDAATALPDNEADRIDLRVASGPAYKLLTWDIGYRREAIKYETREQTLTEAITANARRLITPTVGLRAQAGYESYDFGIPGSVSEGSRWSAGPEWTPTPRTRVAATAGKRLDEDAYTFEFRHRTRLTTWSAEYSEDVTTARSQFFVPATASTAGSLDQLFLAQFPDPAARQKAVEEFIARTGLPPSLGAPVNFFSDQLFLAKRWQASAGLLGVRNTLLANVFTQTREVLLGGVVRPGTGDFAASNSIRLTGASLAWNWRETARNTWNLGVGYTRNEFLDSNRADDLGYVRMGLTRQFQPRLSGSLNYRRQQNESNISGADYTENAVFATLRMRF
jgi:uncharacterized protein (PEP-CTERM system associated)